MEHRFGTRIPLLLNVRLLARPAAIGSGELCDISMSGAFIKTRLRLQLFSFVCIIPELPNRGDRVPRSLHGYVVRLDPQGVGVEWSRLQPALSIAELYGTDSSGERIGRRAEYAHHA